MRELKVQGIGKVAVEPDVVVLSFKVEADSGEYSKTVKKLNKRADDLRKNLMDVGIEKVKIKRHFPLGSEAF